MEYLIQYWWLPGFGILTIALYRYHMKNLAAEQELAELQQHLMKANLEISKQQVKIADLAQQLSQKDSSIEDLLKEINADKQSQSDEQKSTEQFRAQIRKLQETLNAVNTDLAESKKTIAVLQEELKQEQEARALQSSLPFQSLEQFQTKIASLQKVIREQNDAITLLHQKKNMHEQQIMVLRTEVQKQSEQLHAAEAALQKRELELASSFASKDMSSVALQHSMVELEYSVKILEQQLEMEHLAQKNLLAKGKENEEKLHTTIETLKQIIDGQNEELQQFKNRVDAEKNLSATIDELQKKLSRAEQELRDAQHKTSSAHAVPAESGEAFTKTVKTVLYKAPVPAFLLNTKGSIVAINDQFAKIFGASEEQVRGKELSIIFSPEERSFIMEQWNTFESKENYFQGNIAITTVNGTKIQVFFTLAFVPSSWNEPFYIAYLLEVNGTHAV